MVTKNKKLLNDDLENMHLMPDRRYANMGGLFGGALDSLGGGDDGNSGGDGGKSIFEQYPPTYASGEGTFRFDLNPTPETYDFNNAYSNYNERKGNPEGAFRFDILPNQSSVESFKSFFNDNYKDAQDGGAYQKWSILDPSSWFVGEINDTVSTPKNNEVGLRAAGGTVSGTKKATGTAAAGGMWQSALKAITDSINKSNSQTSAVPTKTNSGGVPIPSDGNKGGDGLSTMAVVGIVVGGVAVLGTIIFLASRTTTTTPYTPTPMLPATTK